MGMLVAFQGPSGGGKSTLCKLCGLPYFATYTGRKPRTGEIDGVDYHFTSDEELAQMNDRDECAEFIEYDGHYYATTRKQVQELISGDKTYCTVLTVEGCEQYRHLLGDNLYVIGLYMSVQNAFDRLRKRFGTDYAAIAKRMATYEKEMREIVRADVILSTDTPLEITLQSVEAILKLLQK